MQVVLECVPCYLKQVINTLNQVEIRNEEGQKLLNQLLPYMAELDPYGTPAENSSIILQHANQLLGLEDPFAKAKEESNRFALELLPQLRKVIQESEDSLHTSCLVSVAGNIIDMGILPDYDVEASLNEAMSEGFKKDHYKIFKNKLDKASKVFIIADNSGEIAFDKLLIEQLRLQGIVVIYAVKGGPILNDATLDDVEQVGIREVASVITNGNNFLGTVLERCSQEFLEAMADADIIISKGQANYESLESRPEAGDKTFFLLRAKCEVVAKSLEVKLRDMVFVQNIS